MRSDLENIWMRVMMNYYWWAIEMLLWKIIEQECGRLYKIFNGLQLF